MDGTQHRAVMKKPPIEMTRARAIVAIAGILLGALPSTTAYAEVQSSPISLEGNYLSDSFANLRGGRKTGLRVMGKLSVIADADISAIGLSGAAIHADIQYVHGQSLSGELVGDAQVVSNIDAVSAVRPMEVYVALPFGNARQGAIKAGLIDLNADFDVQGFGAFFLNSSHGIGPDFSQSGANGPSIFPTSASAVTMQWREEGWTARFGLFDAVAGDPNRPERTVVRFPGDTGLLLVGEFDIALGPAAEFQIGAWRYTQQVDTLDGSAAKDVSQGMHGLIEGIVARNGAAELGAWLRTGIASDKVNPISLYLGGGATYGTDQRKVGLAFSHARLGNPARWAAAVSGAPADRAETAIELSYFHQVHKRIAVQPDIQYVVNPGWDPALDDALVVGMRLELSLF